MNPRKEGSQRGLISVKVRRRPKVNMGEQRLLWPKDLTGVGQEVEDKEKERKPKKETYLVHGGMRTSLAPSAPFKNS